MLLVENVEDKEFLMELFKAIYDELPALKSKKKRNDGWRRLSSGGRLADSPLNPLKLR